MGFSAAIVKTHANPVTPVETKCRIRGAKCGAMYAWIGDTSEALWQALGKRQCLAAAQLAGRLTHDETKTFLKMAEVIEPHAERHVGDTALR